MKTLNESIPDLTISYGNDGLILLEQEADLEGNVDRIALHPVHIRLLAEKAGLISKTNVNAKATIATLSRRLLLLKERIDFLEDFLTNYSDHAHADLSYEVVLIAVLSDLAEEFCHGLEPSSENMATTAPTPPSMTAVSHSAKSVATSKPKKTRVGGQDPVSVITVLNAVNRTTSGISRPDLASALSGQLGRTRVYELVSGLVADGRIIEADGILSGADGTLSGADDGADGQADGGPDEKADGRADKSKQSSLI